MSDDNEGSTLRNFAFGDLNPVHPESPRTPSLARRTTPQAAIRQAVVQTHTPNAFAGLTVFRGIVLRVEEATVTAEPGAPTGIVDSILSAIGLGHGGNAGAAVRKRYKIRIPEVHAMLMVPSRVAASYNEPGEHQAIIDTYATFVAENPTTEPASPGDLVWTTFQNIEDLEGGIYLGKVVSQAGNASEAGIAAPSARGTFYDRCTELPGIASSNPITGTNSCVTQDCAVLAGGIPVDSSLIHVPGTTGRRSTLRLSGGSFTGLYSGRQARANNPLQATGHYEPIRNYYRGKAENRRYHSQAAPEIKEALGLMTMSDAGRHMLRILEGNESKVYLDLTSGAGRYPSTLASRPARNGRTSRPTVGVGLLLRDDARHRELWTPYLTPGPASLSTDEAEDLYGYVLDEHCNRFIRHLKVVPTQNQFDGLASVVFNAGTPSWLRDAIEALNQGNPQRAKNIITANGQGANTREHRRRRREREGSLMIKSDSTGGASLDGGPLYANYNKVEGTRQGDLPHWGMRYFGTRIQAMQQLSTSPTAPPPESIGELTPPEEEWLIARLGVLSDQGKSSAELEEYRSSFEGSPHAVRARIMEEARSEG
jgi:GH24 family phage-related lysozyme (muramidase)